MNATELGRYVRHPDGSTVSFCSEDHQRQYRIATASRQVPGTTRLDVPAPDRGTCEHCGHCGVLIAATSACRFHDWPAGAPDCPAFWWEGTICGQRAVSELTRLTGPLPPEAFVLLEDTALRLDADGDFPSTALFDRVWAERDVWAG